MIYLKTILANILCADWIGRCIAYCYGNTIPFYGTQIHTESQEVKPKTKALLFWKMYESAEVRFVNRYLSDQYDVIELGGSIGAVSAQLGKKISNRKLISLEANAALIEIQRQNLITNGITNFELVHAAYGSEQKKIWFTLGEETTLGKIGEANQGNGFFVDSVSLQSLITQFQLKEYVLVCDIEGAEIDLLMNEQDALANCKLLIIETHDALYKNIGYSSENMKELLLQMGFRMIDQYGVNFVMAK
ncbi:MAG TPA: FkbM family methyltransferase [Cytophagaceae bacterium]|jgi:FkbM family methyltransferase|nr:FkbM family methyltransferase [Cytophagaceae bacterium]